MHWFVHSARGVYLRKLFWIIFSSHFLRELRWHHVSFSIMHPFPTHITTCSICIRSVFFFVRCFVYVSIFSHCLFNLSQIAMPLLFCVFLVAATLFLTGSLLMHFFSFHSFCMYAFDYIRCSIARAHILYFTLSRCNVVFWFANTLVRNTRNRRKNNPTHTANTRKKNDIH